MAKNFLISFLILICCFILAPFAFANNVEIAGVEFPVERTIEGKTLKLNGVSILKKFGFVQIYAVGLYLEEPTEDPDVIINSEQVKYVHTQYLTNKATRDKIRHGFIELITTCNDIELVNANKINIEQFSSWIDDDMKPGLSSETIYTPGKGLTLIYQGEIKGTIPGKTFAEMYYRYNVGINANEALKKGLLSLNMETSSKH